MLPNSEGSTQRGQVHVKCLHTQDDQQATSSSQYQVTSFIIVFVNYKWEALRTKFSSSPPLSDSFPTEASCTASRSSKKQISTSLNNIIIMKYIPTSLITLKIYFYLSDHSDQDDHHHLLALLDRGLCDQLQTMVVFVFSCVRVAHTTGGDRCHHFQQWCRWKNYKLRGLMILVFDCAWIGYCQFDHIDWNNMMSQWSFDMKSCCLWTCGLHTCSSDKQQFRHLGLDAPNIKILNSLLTFWT